MYSSILMLRFIADALQVIENWSATDGSGCLLSYCSKSEFDVHVNQGSILKLNLMFLTNFQVLSEVATKQHQPQSTDTPEEQEQHQVEKQPKRRKQQKISPKKSSLKRFANVGQDGDAAHFNNNIPAASTDADCHSAHADVTT